MDARQSVWEQELYSEIEYKKKESLFHCFEGDSSFVGLSFMDSIESNHFNQKIQERIEKRRSRAASYNSTPSSYSTTPSIVVSDPGSSMAKITERPPKKSSKDEKVKSSSSWRPWSKKEKKRGKKKLDKTVIGAPDTGTFQHLQGIKQGGQGGFESVNNMENIDPRLQQIMQIAGLPQSMLTPKKIEKLKEVAEQLDKEYDIYEQIDEGAIRIPDCKPELPMKVKAPSSPQMQPRSGPLPPPPPPPPPPPMPSSNGPLTISGKRMSNKKPEGGIMEQIREGTQLKSAPNRNLGEPVVTKTNDVSMSSMMADMMDRIRDAMSSSEESDGDYDDDSDWGDEK